MIFGDSMLLQMDQGPPRGPGVEASPQTKKRHRASVQHFVAWAVKQPL